MNNKFIFKIKSKFHNDLLSLGEERTMNQKIRKTGEWKDIPGIPAVERCDSGGAV